MSQNGDDAEVRDAMINPVQRRESSASRFLKHFRPDRNNPAYHSEGKGLRKRRNWTSERQLTTTSDNPAGVASAPDPTSASKSGNGTPQRSHSFSEPDGPLVRPSKENSGGMRESFRWRFKSNSSKSCEQPPKGGAVLTRTKSDGLPSSGADAPTPPPPVANWTQQQSSGNLNNKSPSKKSLNDSATVVDGRPQQQQKYQSSEHLPVSSSSSSAPANPEPLYSNGKAGGRVFIRSSSTTSAAEADYVNYEMFASQFNWSQKQLEPDLIRNLPYQQQQQAAQSMVLTSPHRHGNRVQTRWVANLGMLLHKAIGALSQLVTSNWEIVTRRRKGKNKKRTELFVFAIQMRKFPQTSLRKKKGRSAHNQLDLFRLNPLKAFSGFFFERNRNSADEICPGNNQISSCHRGDSLIRHYKRQRKSLASTQWSHLFDEVSSARSILIQWRRFRNYRRSIEGPFVWFCPNADTVYEEMDGTATTTIVITHFAKRWTSFYSN